MTKEQLIDKLNAMKTLAEEDRQKWIGRIQQEGVTEELLTDLVDELEDQIIDMCNSQDINVTDEPEVQSGLKEFDRDLQTFNKQFDDEMQDLDKQAAQVIQDVDQDAAKMLSDSIKNS